MKKLSSLLLSAFVVCCLTSFVGCDNKPDSGKKTTENHKDHDGHDDDGDDHDHHDGEGHPETYKDALAELTKLSDEIKSAFEKEKPAEADGALHKVGHALTDLKDIAQKSDMADEAKVAINGAVDSLFTSFEELHDQMHPAEGEDVEAKSYSDVAANIMTALKTLSDNDK